MRNPFRKRWAVVLRLPSRSGRVSSYREFGRHWSRGMAEERVAELTGRRGNTGQAWASGLVIVERLP